MRWWFSDDAGDARSAEYLSRGLEAMSDGRTLRRYTAILAGLNILIWAAVLLTPHDVRYAFVQAQDLNRKISAIVFGLVLGIGMFFAYSLLRLRFPDVENQNLEADVMATYSYQAHSTFRWRVWLASAVFGVVNLLLLIAVDLWLTS